MASVSKNQRTSTAAGGKTAPMQFVGDVALITPLNQGKHAYVFNPVARRTLHCATDSDAFVEEVRAVVAGGHYERITRQLDELRERHPDHNWDQTKDRLEAAGVFASPA